MLRAVIRPMARFAAKAETPFVKGMLGPIAGGVQGNFTHIRDWDLVQNQRRFMAGFARETPLQDELEEQQRKIDQLTKQSQLIEEQWHLDRTEIKERYSQEQAQIQKNLLARLAELEENSRQKKAETRELEQSIDQQFLKDKAQIEQETIATKERAAESLRLIQEQEEAAKKELFLKAAQRISLETQTVQKNIQKLAADVSNGAKSWLDKIKEIYQLISSTLQAIGISPASLPPNNDMFQACLGKNAKGLWEKISHDLKSPLELTVLGATTAASSMHTQQNYRENLSQFLQSLPQAFGENVIQSATEYCSKELGKFVKYALLAKTAWDIYKNVAKNPAQEVRTEAKELARNVEMLNAADVTPEFIATLKKRLASIDGNLQKLSKSLDMEDVKEQLHQINTTLDTLEEGCRNKQSSKEPEVAQVTDAKEPEVAQVTDAKEPEVAQVTDAKEPEVVQVTDAKEKEVAQVTDPKQQKIETAVLNSIQQLNIAQTALLMQQSPFTQEEVGLLDELIALINKFLEWLNGLWQSFDNAVLLPLRDAIVRIINNLA